MIYSPVVRLSLWPVAVSVQVTVTTLWPSRALMVSWSVNDWMAYSFSPLSLVPFN